MIFDKSFYHHHTLQALKMLRTPELKPFIIYVRPPPFDVLKETRHQVNIIVNVVIITVIIVNIDHCHHECQAYALSKFDVIIMSTSLIIIVTYPPFTIRRMRDLHLMRQTPGPLQMMSFGI